MNIAQVVPVMGTVPPKKYGGIENIVQELSHKLAMKGHQVTIFAAKGSKATHRNIRIVNVSPFASSLDLSRNREFELNEFKTVIKRQKEFDLIHFHYEPIVSEIGNGKKFDNLLHSIKVPFLCTFHNTTHIDKHVRYYKTNKKLHDYPYVFLTKDHREPLLFLRKTHIVNNGIPVEKFKYNGKPKDYLLFLGRITEVKGILEAIEAATKADRKLFIVAKIDPTDKKFYETKVKHLIDGKRIIYKGEANFRQKIEFYRNAECLLMPIKWHEPFGLVIVEAMACGTPVIAFNQGSVPELIKHGKTGYIVNNTDQMVKAIKSIGEISREVCRKHVLDNFSVKKMVSGYEAVYKEILKDKKHINKK